MKTNAGVGAILVLCLLGATICSGQECKARVVAPVTDDLGNHWKVGSILPVDIDRKAGSHESFCASGGSCLPTRLQGTVALTLLNCKVGPAIGGGDYKLVPDAQRSGPVAAMRLQSRQSAEEKLSSLGFSNAMAGSLADDFVNHPHSRNGRLVASALAGSQSAISALRRNNP